MDKESGDAKMLSSSSLKSRKAIHEAISSKVTPTAIKQAKWIMNLLVLCLLVLAIVEFIVIN